jgi:hypothetical protein
VNDRLDGAAVVATWVTHRTQLARFGPIARVAILPRRVGPKHSMVDEPGL